jgi:hypothetical protein
MGPYALLIFCVWWKFIHGEGESGQNKERLTALTFDIFFKRWAMAMGEKTSGPDMILNWQTKPNCPFEFEVTLYPMIEPE